MKKTLIITCIIIAILIGAIGFNNWNARRNATALISGIETETIRRDSLSSTVGATGTVRSNQSATLVWKISGQVDQVLTDVGNNVAASETLATIAEETMPANVILAKADLVNYKNQLDTLVNSSVQQAEARKAVEEAKNALQDAQHPEMVQAEALAAVAAAEKDLDEAQTHLAIITKPVPQNAIDQAYANMLLAENKLNKTLENIAKLELNRTRIRASHIPAKFRKDILKGLNKGLEGLEFVRAQDQLAYDRAVNKYESLLEPPDPLDLTIAEAAVFAAQAQLDNAKVQYERIKDGYSLADIAVLEAKLANAEREYARVKDAPPVEDIAVLEAKIAASQATLDQTSIEAPFNGTITSIEIKSGDHISPGTLAFRIDDLSSLLVDLNVSEIDINLVQPGQAVVLNFDAILAKAYHGTVVEVATVGTENQGITTFQVTVKLTDADESVRPAMTSAVDIVTSEVEDVLLVPNQAIRLLNGERVVYILRDSPEKSVDVLNEKADLLHILLDRQSPSNAIVPIPITLGASSALYSEVISGNLQEGDLVALNPPTDGLSQAGDRDNRVETNP